MLLLILLLIFICVALLSYTAVPIMVARGRQISQNQAQSVVGKIDSYMKEEDIKKMYQWTILSPVVMSIAGLLFFPEGKKAIGVIVGLVLGWVLPRIYVGRLLAVRKQKFSDQLMDCLMIMSSSFRGGLSLVQAFESVVDEMSDPAKGEFSVVLGENKMGVSLDESLNRLYKRMPSAAMQQTVTAILLARETGGNLPVIFSRIISSMRERKKIEKNLQTLTIQGKIQAVVMTGLPLFFFLGVSGTNPHFFDTLLHTPKGQQLLMICFVLWILGAGSIIKISTFKDD